MVGSSAMNLSCYFAIKTRGEVYQDRHLNRMSPNAECLIMPARARSFAWSKVILTVYILS